MPRPKTARPAATAAAAPPSERRTPATPPAAPSRDLQGFPDPAPWRDDVLRFDMPECTCLCPLTGRPDFARFTVEILPDRLCVERGSLKMTFRSFRDEGASHEGVTNAIVDGLVAAVRPRFVRVDARRFVRGGIGTRITAGHRRKARRPAPAVVLSGAGSAVGADRAEGRPA